MTNELTVRAQNPVIPAMSWNKDEVQQNLDEMLAAYTGRRASREPRTTGPRSTTGTSSWVQLSPLQRKST